MIRLTRCIHRSISLAPAALLLAGGCLASKSDIRLLQDELRATRAQVAVGDTSILRADETRRAQIARLETKIDAANDSLRAVAGRLGSFQINTREEFDAVNRQMVQVQALLGQSARIVQDIKAQNQALHEQGILGGTPPASSGAAPAGGSPAANGVPGAATLYTSAVESINNSAYSTARRALEQLLTSYPDYEQAPRALRMIGDTYKAERNNAAADSVFQLVYERFPTNPEAARALYLNGKSLWDANKRSQAQVLFNRVLRDFPRSDEADLIRDLTKRPE
jgi:TolA-binding protein